MTISDKRLEPVKLFDLKLAIECGKHNIASKMCLRFFVGIGSTRRKLTYLKLDLHNYG